MKNLTDSQILEKIKDYEFYHYKKINDRITTKGVDINQKQVRRNLKLIKSLDLNNKKVLDIGCRDGIYSFEAEKMGAKEIIAIDNDISKPAIDFLIPFFDSKVKMHEMNLYELKEKKFGKFDVIFFPGTLYHLRYPFQALKIIIDLLNEGGTLIIETAILNEKSDIAFLFCPVNDDSPQESTACSFFNVKGLVDTLISLGVETQRYDLLHNVNWFKKILKIFLRTFFGKKLLGKNLFNITRGLFLCKKNSKLIDIIDQKYWDSVHKRHSNFQDETKHQKEKNN